MSTENSNSMDLLRLWNVHLDPSFISLLAIDPTWYTRLRIHRTRTYYALIFFLSLFLLCLPFFFFSFLFFYELLPARTMMTHIFHIPSRSTF